jgi:hypothetical protein
MQSSLLIIWIIKLNIFLIISRLCKGCFMFKHEKRNILRFKIVGLTNIVSNLQKITKCGYDIKEIPWILLKFYTSLYVFMRTIFTELLHILICFRTCTMFTELFRKIIWFCTCTMSTEIMHINICFHTFYVYQTRTHILAMFIELVRIIVCFHTYYVSLFERPRFVWHGSMW